MLIINTLTFTLYYLPFTDIRDMVGTSTESYTSYERLFYISYQQP